MRWLFVAAMFFVTACSGESGPPFEVSDIEITEPLPGRSMSAGFMELTNNTDTAITITEVRSPDYGMVEIHKSSIEDGVAKMRSIDELEVPAGSSITLERGGLHLMLMRAKGNPDTVALSFYDGETLVMEVVANVARRAD